MKFLTTWGILILLLGKAQDVGGTNETRTPHSQIDGRCISETADCMMNFMAQQCPKTSLPDPRSSIGQTTTSAVSEVPAPSISATKTTSDADNMGTASAQDGATQTFMSFEDWKELMLRKAGQDPDDLKNRRPPEYKRDQDTVIDQGLDAYGEEGEISLDFEPYPERPGSPSTPTEMLVADHSTEDDQRGVIDDDGRMQYVKSKDAGKTCKERFSYSSFDAGSTVLKTSPGAKNAKAILIENKDSYMLLECAGDNKYVIVELTDDILVDTIVLANFEFFSSMIRHFRVSVSDRYPVKMDKWKVLGTFEAKNSRDIQPFLVENPLIWAKYVRIEFLTHYGKEYYCPVSLLRVHGTRMLESWKESESGRDEDDEEAELASLPGGLSGTDGSSHASGVSTSPLQEYLDFSLGPQSGQCWALVSPLFYPGSELSVCAISTVKFTTQAPTGEKAGGNRPVEAACVIAEDDQATAATEPVPSTSDATSVSASVPTPSALPLAATENMLESSSTTSTIQSITRTSPSEEPTVSTPSPSASKPPPTAVAAPRNKTGSAVLPASVSPTVQESFFKTVSKRLQLLEANITLSLKYIEDQSKHLQDILQKTERKHLSKVDLFLDGLNQTVFAELRGVRQQYDQVWQSTASALEGQREQAEREVIALSSRLNVLADEVVFQKRMSILQSVLLLSCLALVIFSRGLVTPAAANPVGDAMFLPAVAGSGSQYGIAGQQGNGTTTTHSSAGESVHVAGLRQQAIRHKLRRAQSAACPSPTSQRSALAGEIHRLPTTSFSYEVSGVTSRLSPPPSPHLPADVPLGPPVRQPAQRGPVSAILAESRKPLPALPEVPD